MVWWVNGMASLPARPPSVSTYFVLCAKKRFNGKHWIAFEMHASSASIWRAGCKQPVINVRSKIAYSPKKYGKFSYCRFDSMSRRSIFRIYRNKFIPRIDIRVVDIYENTWYMQPFNAFTLLFHALADGHSCDGQNEIRFSSVEIRPKLKFQFCTLYTRRIKATPFRSDVYFWLIIVSRWVRIPLFFEMVLRNRRMHDETHTWK